MNTNGIQTATTFVNFSFLFTQIMMTGPDIGLIKTYFRTFTIAQDLKTNTF